MKLMFGIARVGQPDPPDVKLPCGAHYCSTLSTLMRL